MKKWLAAYESRDLDSLMTLFIPDNELVLIGTGADEKRLGPIEIKWQIERDYTQSVVITVELGWSSVTAAGYVAWMSADCFFRVRMNGREIVIPTRVTTVLERRIDQWLIAQWHVSIPAVGQTDGKSWKSRSP